MDGSLFLNMCFSVVPDDGNTHSVSIERFLVYMFFTAPASLVSSALSDPTVLHILRYHMNEHIEQVIEDRLGYGATSETVLGLVDTPTAPWSNGTVVATLSVSVSVEISTSSSTPLPHAIESLVTSAVTDPTWREERLSVYAVLNRAYAVTTTPLDWSGVILEADGQNQRTQRWWNHVNFWSAEFWSPIAWGDWKNVPFIIFMSVLGGCALLSVFCCACFWVYRRRQLRNQNDKLLEAAVLAAGTLEEDGDDEHDEHGVVVNNEELAGDIAEYSSNNKSASGVSSSYSYIEEEIEDDDIQSFDINPGSAYDFGGPTAADAVSYEEVEVTDDDDDDEDVVSTSDSKKGTVVMYNNHDSDSVSTASDSIMSAILDFAKAAWNKEAPSKPKSVAPSTNRSPRGRSGNVRAAIASFEKVSKPALPKTIPLPKHDASNVLGIVSRIEQENRLETTANTNEDDLISNMEAGERSVNDFEPAPPTIEKIDAVVEKSSATVPLKKPGMLSSFRRMLFSSSNPTDPVVLSDIEDGLTSPSHGRTGGDSLESCPPTMDITHNANASKQNSGATADKESTEKTTKPVVQPSKASRDVVEKQNQLKRQPAHENTVESRRLRSLTPPPTRSLGLLPSSPASDSTRSSSAPSPERSVAKAGTVLARISAFEKKPTPELRASNVPVRRLVPRPPARFNKSTPSWTGAHRGLLSMEKDKDSSKLNTSGVASTSIETETTVQSSVQSLTSDNTKDLSVHTTSSEQGSTSTAFSLVTSMKSTSEASHSVERVPNQVTGTIPSWHTQAERIDARQSEKQKNAKCTDFIDISRAKTAANPDSGSPRKSKTSVSDAVRVFEQKSKGPGVVAGFKTGPTPSISTHPEVGQHSSSAEKVKEVCESTALKVSNTSTAVPITVIENASPDVPAWLRTFNQIQAQSSNEPSVPSALLPSIPYQNAAIMVADDDIPGRILTLDDENSVSEPRTRGRSRHSSHKKDIAPVKLESRMKGRSESPAEETEQNSSCISSDAAFIEQTHVIQFPQGRRAQSATPHDRQTSSFLENCNKPEGDPEQGLSEEQEQPKGSFVLRTNLDISFKKTRRSQSAAPRERHQAGILRTWSDAKSNDTKKIPFSFSGKSARSSKATKLVLKGELDSPGTPGTLPLTPSSNAEYQDSETSDIKSICSKDPVFALYDSAHNTPNSSPLKRMGSLRLNANGLVTVDEGDH